MHECLSSGMRNNDGNCPPSPSWRQFMSFWQRTFGTRGASEQRADSISFQIHVSNVPRLGSPPNVYLIKWRLAAEPNRNEDPQCRISWSVRVLRPPTTDRAQATLSARDTCQGRDTVTTLYCEECHRGAQQMALWALLLSNVHLAIKVAASLNFRQHNAYGRELVES